MSTDDKTAPLRDLLKGLSGQPSARPVRCGGAIVPVNRDCVQTYERLFDVDLVVPDGAPREGTFEARVACSNEVMAKMGVGGLVHDGTCARCAGVERRVRAKLAEAAARRGT